MYITFISNTCSRLVKPQLRLRPRYSYVDLELERRLKQPTYSVFSETLNPDQSIRLKEVRILALSRRPKPRISITGWSPQATAHSWITLSYQTLHCNWEQHDFSRYCYQHYQLGLGVKTREDMFPPGRPRFCRGRSACLEHSAWGDPAVLITWHF